MAPGGTSSRQKNAVGSSMAPAARWVVLLVRLTAAEPDVMDRRLGHPAFRTRVIRRLLPRSRRRPSLAMVNNVQTNSLRPLRAPTLPTLLYGDKRLNCSVELPTQEIRT